MVGIRLLPLLVGSLIASGQTPAELYKAHCAGCHGPAGEGSRGPSLKLTRIADTDTMVNLLRRGVPGTEMPSIAPSVISDQNVRALASYVLAFRTESAGASGRTARGAELFRTKGKCLDCHRLNGEGRPLGPDLSAIGRDRDANWLRSALTDPQAEIYDSFGGYRWTIDLPDNYLLVDAATKSGERISGPRINEDAFSIQLRDAAGKVRSLLKSELTELRKQWGKSPMPSYKSVLADGELDDLVAYMSSLRGAR